MSFIIYKKGTHQTSLYHFVDFETLKAWECIWNELIVEKKGIKTFLDRDTLDYGAYTYSFELKNEMWHQINRLIEKYEVKDDQVAIDLVNILKGHRCSLYLDLCDIY